MEDSYFISIGERAYRYIRQFTIKSVQDALVELITNSIDAYNKTTYLERRIDIDIYDGSTVLVRDRAIGLSAENLQKCFLQIGNFTADESSRGFFSRGAKDISALGDITFSTIKNDLFSQCTLNTDAYGKMIYSDVPLSNEIRDNHKIPFPFSGLEVKLDLLPNFRNINTNILFASLCKLVVLRDIVSNINNNYIYLNEFDSHNVLLNSRRIKYEYPEGELLLELIYNIPNYDNAQAKLVIYKSNNKITQPISESELEFGFLIKDNYSIYEATTVQDRFRWNPYMNSLFGYIKCDYIHKLLIDYDIEGPTIMNPYPIIDPSRITGVNKLHPFIINLLSIPALRVDQILRDLNKTLSTSSVSITDINDLLDELQKYGLDIIEKEDIEVSFIPSYDANLAKAILDERANYVTYEKSYVLSDLDVEQVSINDYVKSEIVRLYPNYDPTSLFLYNPDNKLVELLNMNYSEFNNEQIDILTTLPTENIETLNKHPYIYNLSSTGDVSKLYIFNKGTITSSDSTYDKIIVRNKQFKIEFIDDINIDKRYIIDNTNGVTIQINLHNSIVSKYLKSPLIDNSIDLQNISSTKSIVFLKELMTDILADLILESDINKSKIILDSTSSYTNAKKILDYRNIIIFQIETSIDNMFDKILDDNKNKKINTITSLINVISNSVGSQMEVSEDLTNLKLSLISTLMTTLE